MRKNVLVLTVDLVEVIGVVLWNNTRETMNPDPNTTKLPYSGCVCANVQIKDEH